jgi:hypothetical protein
MEQKIPAKIPKIDEPMESERMEATVARMRDFG